MVTFILIHLSHFDLFVDVMTLSIKNLVVSVYFLYIIIMFLVLHGQFRLSSCLGNTVEHARMLFVEMIL